MGASLDPDMGVLGGFVKLSAALVLLVAILIGSLLDERTNFLKKAGLFRALDGWVGARGKYAMGFVPMMHDDTPWGFSESDMPDLTGQSMLVTGGNTGLGYWTAFHLARAKADVTIACRSQSRCDAAADELFTATGANVSTGVLDLASFASIRSFAGSFKPKALHSLILNAGVMAPPFSLTQEGLEMQIGTNHFGHFLLTDLLLSKLEKAADSTPTIVVVSSCAHYDSYPEGVRWTVDEMNDEALYSKMQGYGQSKLANVLFAQELAERLEPKGILVNSIHPGVVETELKRHVLDVIEPVIGKTGTDYFQTLIAGMSWHPRDASLTQVYAAVGVQLKREKITGKYFHPIARVNEAPDLHSFNTTLQRRLWELSIEFIQSH